MADIQDIVARGRRHFGPFGDATGDDRHEGTLLRELAAMAGLAVDVDQPVDYEPDTVLAVHYEGQRETLRFWSREWFFPPVVLVAYLNGKLADRGDARRFVSCRDGKSEAVVLAEPHEAAELRASIYEIRDDTRWPAAMIEPAERELLAAIRAAPDDDGPRLVYADWLMERGDPRGVYIATELRGERVRGSIFSLDGSLSSLSLWTLDGELLEGHRAAWTSHLPVWVQRATLERGFVSTIVLDRAQTAFRHRAEICAWTPIPAVYFRDHPTDAVVFGPTPRLAVHRAVAPDDERFAVPGSLFRVIDLEAGDVLHEVKREGIDRFGFSPDGATLWLEAADGDRILVELPRTR